jgi:hypothetical protein
MRSMKLILELLDGCNGPWVDYARVRQARIVGRWVAGVRINIARQLWAGDITIQMSSRE